MITPDYVRLMAAYTCWQNKNVYAAAATLSDEARKEDRGAFFASIHATLNHVLWGDQFWLSRLAKGPVPRASSIAESQNQHPLWSELSAARLSTDEFISTWAAGLVPQELEGEIVWFSAARNQEIRRPRGALVVQLFNHGTHHRGQAHAMLTAAGARLSDTDVHFMPAEFYEW